MTNHNASKVKTVLNQLWIYGMMGASGILVACAAPPNPTPDATVRSDLLDLETRIQNLENQSNVQNQFRMEWSSVQDRIEKLEKLQENIQEIKRLERNQNQLLLEYQQEFEDRMARLEADLERNSQRIRKITANEELQNGTGISSEQASSQTGSAQELETFGSDDSTDSQIPVTRPPSVEQQFEIAWELYNTKQFFKAIELLREFRMKHPQHPSAVEAHYLIGDAYYSLQDYPSAAIELYDFVEQNSHHPSNTDARWKLAQSLEKSGEIGLALSIYQELASQIDAPYQKQAQKKLEEYENQ